MCRKKTEAKRKGAGKKAARAEFAGMTLAEVTALNGYLQRCTEKKRIPRLLTAAEQAALESYWEYRLNNLHISMRAGDASEWLDYGHDAQLLDYGGSNTVYQTPTFEERLEKDGWPISLC